MPSAGEIRKYIKLADSLAEGLFQQECDVSEVAKAKTMLINNRDYDKTSRILSQLLQTKKYHHSKKTPDYLKNVIKTLNEIRNIYPNSTEAGIAVLGWTHKKLRFRSEKKNKGDPG